MSKNQDNLGQINQQVADLRAKLTSSFPTLAPSDITAREAQTWSHQDVLVKTLDAIRDGSHNVDFRYFKSVNLDNTIFTAVALEDLPSLLRNSKFEQENFCLINFDPNSKMVSYRVGKNVVGLSGELNSNFDIEADKFFGTQDFGPVNLNINCTGCGNVRGNIKFSTDANAGSKDKSYFLPSLIYDEIGHFACDTREAASTGQALAFLIATGDPSLSGSWRVNLMSIAGAKLVGDQTSRTPKMTHGGLTMVYNGDNPDIEMYEYKYMDMDTIYYDTNQAQFRRVTEVDSEVDALLEVVRRIDEEVKGPDSGVSVWDQEATMRSDSLVQQRLQIAREVFRDCGLDFDAVILRDRQGELEHDVLPAGPAGVVAEACHEKVEVGLDYFRN